MIRAVILSTAEIIQRLQQGVPEDTSNTAPWQEGQRTKDTIVEQLKVGLTHRVPTLVPATNGKSRTSVIIVYCHERRNKSPSTKYAFGVTIKIDMGRRS